MSTNLYKAFRDLIPTPPLQIGTVVAFDGSTATIELPGGGLIQARGETTVGSKVFELGGAIDGPAPDLPIEVIEV